MKKKSIVGLQGGPKTGLLSLFLRVANFGTADLDFVCVISMSLTGFMCINGNHFRCPSGRFVGIASHYCVK